MCGSSGQREVLSSLCSVKGQDFKRTSLILFQLNPFDSVSVKICFRLTCGFSAKNLGFCNQIANPGWTALGKSPTPALLPQVL